MEFDPAVAARKAFEQVRASDEVGAELDAAEAAEERFSGSAGEESSEAYRELVAIGSRHPDAESFSEFLVYITWSHLMDETHPEHFRRGLALCRDLLSRDPGKDSQRLKRLRDMEQSFRSGLGESPGDSLDYEADTLTGGD